MLNIILVKVDCCETAAAALHCHRCFLQALPSIRACGCWTFVGWGPGTALVNVRPFNQIIAESQHGYPLPLSRELPPSFDLEGCSLTCISLYFHVRQVEKLSVGELSIFQLCVLDFANCSLPWEWGIQFVLVTLAATFLYRFSYLSKNDLLLI